MPHHTTHMQTHPWLHHSLASWSIFLHQRAACTLNGFKDVLVLGRVGEECKDGIWVCIHLRHSAHERHHMAHGAQCTGRCTWYDAMHAWASCWCWGRLQGMRLLRWLFTRACTAGNADVADCMAQPIQCIHTCMWQFDGRSVRCTQASDASSA